MSYSPTPSARRITRSTGLALLAAALLTGCEMGPDSSPFGNLEIEPAIDESAHTPVENIVPAITPEPKQESEEQAETKPEPTIAPDPEQSPVENHPVAEPEPEMVNAWIKAPEGFCDDPANQESVKYVTDGERHEGWFGPELTLPNYIFHENPESVKRSIQNKR